jgi:ATP-binding cassette subfamily B protein
MSDGYDTFVGERGTRLSGGQRQRIAIARAILRNPEIFILDEATSALDSSTEMAINTTLNQLIKGRTSITVTHRLTTVIGADCIFVMKEGKICERGSHQSLLSQNGFYKQLWDKQHGFIINAEEDEVIPTVERLQLIELFNALPRDFLENSIPLFKTVICGGNQLVMQEGDSSDLFYIIVRGKVSIEKSNKNFPVTVLTDGDYFGEVALLREISRTATVKTVTRCVFLTLQRQDFMQLLKRSPELQQRLEIVVQARIDMPY